MVDVFYLSLTQDEVSFKKDGVSTERVGRSGSSFVLSQGNSG